MSAWMVVAILLSFLSAGLLIRAAAVARQWLQDRARVEPENCMPGRVLEPGVPINRALMDGAEHGARHVRSKATVGAFREGQWLRSRETGSLREYMGSSMAPDCSWVRLPGSTVPELAPNEELEEALPKRYEIWTLDHCKKGHQQPEEIADLLKTGKYGYNEQGVWFTAWGDWSPGPGTLACVVCGCLKPEPSTEDVGFRQPS